MGTVQVKHGRQFVNLRFELSLEWRHSYYHDQAQKRLYRSTVGKEKRDHSVDKSSVPRGQYREE